MTHEPASPKRAPGRAGVGLARALGAAALVLAAGACEVPPDPYNGCPGATGPVVAPPDALVAAGDAYQARPVFPDYPCIVSAAPHCDGLGCALPWPFSSIQVDSTTAQGTCAPEVSVVSGPALATGAGGVVRWTPGRADEGQTVRLEVESRYPEGCAQQRTAWNVTVLPGPPPPVLRGIVLDREDVRPGETVTAVVTFEGGRASWNHGPLESGVPATSPPLRDSGLLEFEVEGGIGEVIRESRRVQIWPPPVIVSFTAGAQRVHAGEEVLLSWGGYGFSEASISPPPVWSQLGFARVLVDATTTYTLTARTPLGDEATAQVTIAVAPPPVIHAFSALAAEVPVGGAPTLVAIFEHGTGGLEVLRSAAAWTNLPGEPLGPIESGVAFTAPAQRGFDRYRLVVSDGLGRQVTAELAVPVTGPGSFSPLAIGAERPLGPRLIPMPDGRLLVAGGVSYTGALAPGAELLDLTTGAAVRADLSLSMAPGAFVLDDGRLAYTEEPYRDPGSNVLVWWGGPIKLRALAEPWSIVDVPVSDPDLVERLRSARLLSLGGTRVLAISRPPTAAVTLVDVATGAASPVALAAGLGWVDGTPCRLADGRALLAGGAALYDPGVGMVEPVPGESPLLQERILRCLVDGTALRVSSGWPSSVIERFDPAAGAWARVAYGPLRLDDAAELPDGRVLLVGPTEGWVFEPGTSALSRVGRLAVPRVDPSHAVTMSAVALADGQVVVHGWGAGLPERFAP